MGSLPRGGEGVDSERELMLEDARSISEGLWRIAQLAQEAAESLNTRIEDEDLDGMAEAVEVREVLETPAGPQSSRCARSWMPEQTARLMRDAPADPGIPACRLRNVHRVRPYLLHTVSQELQESDYFSYLTKTVSRRREPVPFNPASLL